MNQDGRQRPVHVGVSVNSIKILKDMNAMRYKCPKCGQMTGVRIIYGLPGVELAEAEERGEIELGGCFVEDNDPNVHCKTCGHEWRFPKSTKA